jgi:hypothetical protein
VALFVIPTQHKSHHMAHEKPKLIRRYIELQAIARQVDPSGQKRLDYVVSKIGHLPIDRITKGDLQGIVDDRFTLP